MREKAQTSLALSRGKTANSQISVFERKQNIDQHVKFDDSLNIEEANPIFDKLQKEYIEI